MNLFDSKKKLGIAGVVMGLVQQHLLILVTQRTWQSVLRVLYVIQQEHLDFILQSQYSMQDRRSSESSSVHLLFQLRQKNIVQQQDLPQSYVLYSE